MPSNIHWLGTAQAVAQVNRVTPGGTVAAGSTFTITINGKSITYTAVGADAVATIVTELFTRFAACQEPEFLEINARDTGASGYLTLTAKVAGVPFTVTSSAGGSGSPTCSTTTPTANSGPNVISVGANYSGGSAPGNSDTVTFTGSVPALYDLGALSAVTGLVIIIRDVTSTFRIGLPPENVGGKTYYEYRPQSLTTAGGTVTIDAPQCGLIRLNFGASAATVNCYRTGSRAVSNLPALTLVGTHPANAFNLFGGDVGIAMRPTETSVVAALKVGTANPDAAGGLFGAGGSSAKVAIGAGVTVTAATVQSGSVDSESSIGTLTAEGGVVTTRGATTITTANVRDAAQLAHESTGTITTLNLGPKGKFDKGDDYRPNTVTNCTVYEGAVINDPAGSVTWTNGIALKCRVKKADIDVGNNRTLSVA